jgi:hypothetical protein
VLRPAAAEAACTAGVQPSVGTVTGTIAGAITDASTGTSAAEDQPGRSPSRGGGPEGGSAMTDAAAMKAYVDPRPRSKIGQVRVALMILLEQHLRDQAVPTSVRFLFYELVARRIVAKSGEHPDKIVSEALTDLRERGHVPWDWIVDETRSVENFTGSATVAEDWLAFLSVSRLDPWHGKPPFILTESRSLAGVLRDIAREYRIYIAPTNGQVGGFLHTDVAPKLHAGDRVGYLGDFDLAGGDIEANTSRVLEDILGGKLDWTRLALTKSQVDRYELPRIIKTDKRFKNGGGRHEAVETEALSQTLIVNIVRNWLDELLPQRLDRVLVRERRQRGRLRRL